MIKQSENTSYFITKTVVFCMNKNNMNTHECNHVYINECERSTSFLVAMIFINYIMTVSLTQHYVLSNMEKMGMYFYKFCDKLCQTEF